MSYFTKKEQIIIIFLILVIVFISVFSFLNKSFFKSNRDREDEEVSVEDLLTELEDQNEEEIDTNKIIMVHISGEVYNPGIIELKLGSRVIDAVNLSGGLKKDVDLDKINLAKRLSDEEKIYIPKVGEEYSPTEVSNPTTSSSDNSSVENKVNINTCTKEELIALPGIGEVLAGRILDYREENLFKTIDDIRNVSGIGEKKYESIKELIIVK